MPFTCVTIWLGPLFQNQFWGAQESISFKPVKPTVKPTLKSTPVPQEMLKAVVATNKAENAVRCWLIKMVLFRIKKKKIRVIHFWILWFNSKQISCWLGRKLQLNVCFNHMLNFKRSDIIEHHVWTQEETQENKAKASEVLSQLCKDRALLFSYPLRIHAQLDTTWEAVFMYSHP